MKQGQTLSLKEDLLAWLVDYLDQHFIRPGRNLSRVAIIFGGKRPALFVKRGLSRLSPVPFYPPQFFTIDEWMAKIVEKDGVFKTSQYLETCYAIYNMARRHCPDILGQRTSFAKFMPWAGEILGFLDNLDLEAVRDEKLRGIRANAQIGYSVPDEVNRLLEHVLILRKAYHEYMRETKNYSRGYQYLRAASIIENVSFNEFDQIIFCNFFYLHQTESTVIKNLCDRDLAMCVFQGSQDDWPTLKGVAQNLGIEIQEPKRPNNDLNIKLHSAFDGHSQVAMAREIIRQIPDLSKAVIVIPEAAHMIPLMAEIDPLVRDYNISMGYPLKRSALYSLLTLIFQAQASRDMKGLYYSLDYLRVIRHPLLKNLDLGQGSAVARVLVHKIEEILTGILPSELSGHLFLDPWQFLQDDNLYEHVSRIVKGMGLEFSRDHFETVFKRIHDVGLGIWQTMDCFQDFSGALESFLLTMTRNSNLEEYPINIKVIDQIYDIKDEIQSVSFHQEKFRCEELFKIFIQRLDQGKAAFAGSPLKGLQILGLFETRSLNFENVIVLDVNEGVMPRLNILDPLIPREVLISLNLDRLEQDEEIQRYQLMRLIAGAKNVHLIYEENDQKERSRFIEEIVWQKEKEQGALAAPPIISPGFAVTVQARSLRVAKNTAIINFLKSYRFSASSLNTYLRSPLEFYYSHVLGLRERENLLEEPENRQIGTFVHEFLEHIFKTWLGQRPVFDQEFRTYFKKALAQRFEQTFGAGRSSDAYLLKTILSERMERFIQAEAENPRRQIEKILYIEKQFETQIPVAGAFTKFVLRVDRVDQMPDGTITVVDYKTGSVDPMPDDWMRISSMPLSRENIRDHIKSFQIPLYFYYLSQAFPGKRLDAVYYNLRTLELSCFADSLKEIDYSDVNKAFLRAVEFIILEMINPQVPFCDEL